MFDQISVVILFTNTISHNNFTLICFYLVMVQDSSRFLYFLPSRISLLTSQNTIMNIQCWLHPTFIISILRIFSRVIETDICLEENIITLVPQNTVIQVYISNIYSYYYCSYICSSCPLLKKSPVSVDEDHLQHKS